MMIRAFAFGAVVIAGVASASAQQAATPTQTVQSLIASGYVVESSFASQIGPGIFLQKGDSLYLCFVSETTTSTDVKTQYCKPVH